VLGVTGTAGKTTTARLAEAMLRASGCDVLTACDAPADNAWPTAELLGRVLAARPGAWCVAELTSNHLAVCSASPQIACITNVWADHVDQHGSLAAYVEAKRRIVEFQASEDWTVVNAGDSGGLLAAACALLAGASPDAIASALAGWTGLALRREHLGRIDGSEVIRDALAATPAKAAAGLALHASGTVVLIAGGHDELAGGPLHDAPQERALFEQAAAVAARACAHAALFGPAAPRLASALAAAGLTSITIHESLPAACADARAHAIPGRTILFAPWFATTTEERAAVPELLGLNNGA
jgi:UDP-N-acetylmuramoylalanine--D-glutamate ligase